MTAKSPSEDPQLPQLRRFRFLPDAPDVPREVAADGTLLDPPADESPSDQAPADQSHRDRSELDLHESEQLLAALEAPLDGDPTSHGDLRAAAQPAQAAAEPMADADRRPPSIAAAARPRAGRATSWPFLVAGVVLAVIIAGVVWFVAGSGDDAGTSADAGTPQEPAAELTVADWADSMCTELADFQTTAMPLRAEAAKASASSAATMPDVDVLRRNASGLLIELAADLQQIGMPTENADAAGVHTTVLSAVNAAASATNPSVTPTPAESQTTPAEAATSVLSALDRPLVVFRQAVEDLAEESRDAISSAPACAPLF